MGAVKIQEVFKKNLHLAYPTNLCIAIDEAISYAINKSFASKHSICVAERLA